MCLIKAFCLAAARSAGSQNECIEGSRGMSLYLLGVEVVCWSNDDGICLSHSGLFQAHCVVWVAGQVKEVYAIDCAGWHPLTQRRRVLVVSTEMLVLLKDC